MPKVSVIIPVYNVERYLRECLISIINQTFKDIEIICVNDGSTDGSLEILKEYETKDKRIKVIDKKNEGAAIARNTGIKHSCSKYLIFFDADDYMELNALECLYNTAETASSDVTICRAKQIEPTGELNNILYSINNKKIDNKKVFSPEEIHKHVFQFCVGWPWDKLYRRDFITSNHIEFQDLRHSNDTYFVLSSLILAGKISITEEHLMIHRRHSASLSNTRSQAPRCFYFALLELYKLLKESKLYEKYEQSFVNYCITFPIWHIDTINDEQAKSIMIKYLVKLLNKINLKKYPEDFFYYKREYDKVKYLYRNNSNVFKKFFKTVLSIENIGVHKVITVFGVTFKIKLKSLVERERFMILERKLNYLLSQVQEIKQLLSNRQETKEKEKNINAA